ncbi:aromatic amino acid ammonia-lyase [Streptomyces sp. NPDC005805]|uniref:HAL/PAL/TAL family ammonia-lyase n=1 Tax=Streptomyces sp. NPDC005805 TaxID=3157068 RepID=UPI0033F1A4EB
MTSAAHTRELRLNRRLTVEDVERAGSPLTVETTATSGEAVARCHDFVARTSARGTPVYGITTGYGALVGHAGAEDDEERSRGLIDFLTVGHGPPLEPAVVRGMLLIRLACLGRGHSGASPAVVGALRGVLATPLAPVVPRHGSVGASGDLVPLAHAVQALRGNGEFLDGEQRSDAEASLEKHGLKPLELTGRDALALVNGTSLTAAAAALAVARAKRRLTTSLLLTAALAEVLGASGAMADDDLTAATGHPGVREAARCLRGLLDGGHVTGGRPLQEAYTLRCVPQLVGAALEVTSWAEHVVGNDLNGVSDNPVFFPDLDKVAHGGNFFGQSVAFAADALTNALTQLANLAERQLDLVLDPHRNGGLPPMLTDRPGRRHGMTGLQLSATATVMAMRRECVPAGMQSLPTNGHNQDIVPFGNEAALTALAQADRLRTVQAMLGLALYQAAHLAGRAPTAAGGRLLHDALIGRVEPVLADRPLDTDVRRTAGALDEAADRVLPLRPRGEHR